MAGRYYQLGGGRRTLLGAATERGGGMGQAVWCLSKPSYAWASAPPQPSTKVEERRLASQAGRLELNGCTCRRGRGRRGLFGGGPGPKQPLGCAGKALGSPAVDSDGGHADTCGRRLARREGAATSRVADQARWRGLWLTGAQRTVVAARSSLLSLEQRSLCTAHA